MWGGHVFSFNVHFLYTIQDVLYYHATAVLLAGCIVGLDQLTNQTIQTIHAG
jgi:hypothetical protein